MSDVVLSTELSPVQKKSQQPRRVVPAVDRAARMLALIEDAARPMSITDLARQLDASKGTVREILETLRAHGLLERDDITKLYRLGPQLARLGASSVARQDLASVARPHLAALSESQREIAVLLVPQDKQLLIQAATEPSNPRIPIVVAATPGRTFPVTAGACGKVYFAWGGRGGMTAPPRKGAKRHKALQADLALTARRGYATDDEEFMTGVRGVSAPVLGPDGRLAGLVLLSGLTGSLTIERMHDAGAATRSAADAMSRAIGGPGVVPPGGTSILKL